MKYLKDLVPQRLKNFYHLLRSYVARLYFNDPARELVVIGVTGTDGKTTTCYYLYSILSAAGLRVGLVSSIEARIGEQVLKTGLHVTSPDAWEIQKLLRRMLDSGIKYLVLEVTSHAIDQNRFAGIPFAVAGLTNIEHEHLDYHKTFESYKQAKLRLLREAQVAVKAAELEDSLLKGVEVKLAGEYNRKNAKLAVAMAKALNIPNGAIKVGIEELTLLPGRMETVHNNDFRVIIDFAHTPNGLKNALHTVRKMVKPEGRVILVFGSAGRRDYKKRPIMGKIAGELADLVVVTAEDPRGEKVMEISKQIANGLKEVEKEEGEDYFLIPDRQVAINYALRALAKKGDLVIIAGKGHEQSMSFGDKEYPWSEHEAVKKALRGRKGSGP